MICVRVRVLTTAGRRWRSFSLQRIRLELNVAQTRWNRALAVISAPRVSETRRFLRARMRVQAPACAPLAALTSCLFCVRACVCVCVCVQPRWKSSPMWPSGAGSRQPCPRESALRRAAVSGNIPALPPHHVPGGRSVRVFICCNPDGKTPPDLCPDLTTHRDPSSIKPLPLFICSKILFFAPTKHRFL